MSTATTRPVPVVTVTETELLETSGKPGHYVLEEYRVTLSDKREPIVRVWYYTERDGFDACVEFEVWNERDTRIVQQIQEMPGSEFDFALVALAARKPDVYWDSLIEGDDPSDEGGWSDWDQAWHEAQSSHIPW